MLLLDKLPLETYNIAQNLGRKQRFMHKFYWLTPNSENTQKLTIY